MFASAVNHLTDQHVSLRLSSSFYSVLKSFKTSTEILQTDHECFHTFRNAYFTVIPDLLEAKQH